MDQETLDIIATIDDETLTKLGHTFTLRSGVVLSLRKVSPVMVGKGLQQLVEPEVPQVYIEDKETYEENPGDPDYLKAKQAYILKRGAFMQDVYLGRGTELKHLPDSVAGPETDDWIYDAEFLGIKVTNRESKLARYIQWLYFMLDTIEELQCLVQAAQAYNGLISEEEVLKEMYFFRHPEERPKPDTSTDTEEASDRRDVSADSARDGIDLRTDGSSEVRPVNVASLPEIIARRASEVSSAL